MNAKILTIIFRSIPHPAFLKHRVGSGGPAAAGKKIGRNLHNRHLGFHLLFALAAVFTLWQGTVTAASEDRVAKTFRVFDATLYRGKPYLSSWGIERLHVIYEAQLWGPENLTAEFPSLEMVREKATAAARLAPDLVCLDIERWDFQKHSENKSLEGYLEVVHRFREAGYKGRVGLYGLPPFREYYGALQPTGQKSYLKWQRRNNFLQPLAEQVDVFFPSLYTFTADVSKWERYAAAQISEARRYDATKPVYVFLWPQFHPNGGALSTPYIAPLFWRRQLEVAHTLADGLVIWGGWGERGTLQWDEDAGWWTQTKAFIEAHGLKPNGQDSRNHSRGGPS